MSGGERSLFEALARQTGGASFNLREMKRASDNEPSGRIFDVVRACYTLTLSGNLALSERMKIEVKRPESSSCPPSRWSEQKPSPLGAGDVKTSCGRFRSARTN